MSDFGDRAPPPGPRPARNYRAKVACQHCGVAAGEVHAVDCPGGGPPEYKSGYRGS